MTISIEHVGVWVNDLEKMKSFYEKYFNVVATKKYYNPKTEFSSYFLNFENGARLELCHRPDIVEKNKNSFGFYHLAIAVGDKVDVDTFAKRFEKDGFPIQSF